MSLIVIVVTLLFVGFIMWLIGQTPIDAKIKNIIYGVVILFVVLWLLQSIGILGAIGDVRVK